MGFLSRYGKFEYSPIYTNDRPIKSKKSLSNDFKLGAKIYKILAARHTRWVWNFRFWHSFCSFNNFYFTIIFLGVFTIIFLWFWGSGGAPQGDPGGRGYSLTKFGLKRKHLTLIHARFYDFWSFLMLCVFCRLSMDCALSSCCPSRTFSAFRLLTFTFSLQMIAAAPVIHNLTIFGFISKWTFNFLLHLNSVVYILCFENNGWVQIILCTLRLF